MPAHLGREIPNKTAYGRRTYPLLQCDSVWYTELDNAIEDPLMKEIRYLDKLVDELAKGKEESRTAGQLFCADLGASCTAGIRSGGGKNRTVFGTVDDPFCHQQSVGFGRRIVRLGRTGLSVCADQITS